MLAPWEQEQFISCVYCTWNSPQCLLDIVKCMCKSWMTDRHVLGGPCPQWANDDIHNYPSPFRRSLLGYIFSVPRGLHLDASVSHVNVKFVSIELRLRNHCFQHSLWLTSLHFYDHCSFNHWHSFVSISHELENAIKNSNTVNKRGYTDKGRPTFNC